MIYGNAETRLGLFTKSVIIAVMFFVVSLFAELYAEALALQDNLYYTGRIVPRPQSVVYGNEFSPSEQGKLAHIEILTAEDSSSFPFSLASELKDSFLQLRLKMVDAVSVGAESSTPDAKSDLVIYLLMNRDLSSDSFSPLNEHFSEDDRPLPPEGYRLSVKQGKPASIIVQGTDERGLFYGLQSLKQMVFVRSNQLHLQEVSVYDYPAYRDRISGNDENTPEKKVSLAAVDYLSFLKMTGWAVGQSYWWPQDWRETPQAYVEALTAAASKARQTGFDLVYQVHPFGRANDPEKRYTIRITDEKDRKVLQNTVSQMLAAGSKSIILRADDFHDLTGSDLAGFADKASAHIYLVNDLFGKMRVEAPQARLIFCPPYYWSNQFKDEDVYRYINRLSREIHTEVDIMWTGPEVVSHNISNDDVRQFTRITNKKPLLWDNTALPASNRFGYPYRYAFYLFQQFTTDYGSEHVEKSQGIRFNYGYDGSEIKRTGNAVLADYLWNPDSYEPHGSLRDAIGLVVGKDAINRVLQLSDYLLLAFDLGHSPAYTLSQHDLPSVVRVQGLLRELEASTTNQNFAKEMENVWWTMYQTILSLEEIEQQRNVIHQNHLASIKPDNSVAETNTNGEWKIVLPENREDPGVFQFSHPFYTPGFEGSKGEVRFRLTVPFSPTGKYYLHFMADDDYYADGEPPEAWPGYFFKELQVDDRLVWSEDIVGRSEMKIVEVEVTELLQDREEIDIVLRAADRKGVYNLGVMISFSEIYLSPQSLDN
jgi:hypothetical protein